MSDDKLMVCIADKVTPTSPLITVLVIRKVQIFIKVYVCEHVYIIESMCLCIGGKKRVARLLMIFNFKLCYSTLAN